MEAQGTRNLNQEVANVPNVPITETLDSEIGKIDPHRTSFVVDAPSASNRGCIERMCAHCDDSLVQFTTMPNHQMHCMEPPAGNVTVWKSDARFIADPFYCNLFTATVVKEVPFTDSTWTSPVRKEMLQRLNNGVPQISPAPPSLVADDRNFDTRPWKASLGDRRGYIGLFCSRCKDLQSRQWYNKWFMVCRAGLDPATYEELEEHFVTCEEEGRSFSDVFDGDKRVTRARILAKRNRRRLLKQAADILGIPIDSRKDAHAVTPNEADEIASIDLETETNFIKKMGAFHVFYRTCCCTEDSKGGIVINRAPQLGPIVLSGPNTSTSANAFFRGGTWTNTLYGAFPVEMGFVENESQAKNPRTPAHMFTWMGKNEGDADDHPLLTRTYRHRCSAWRDIERHLGYGGNGKNRWRDPIELQPVIVKLSL